MDITAIIVALISFTGVVLVARLSTKTSGSVDEHGKKIQALEDRNDALEKKNDNLEKKITILEEQRATDEATIEALTQQIGKMAGKITRLEEQHIFDERTIENLRSRVKVLEKEKEDMQRRLNENSIGTETKK